MSRCSSLMVGVVKSGSVGVVLRGTSSMAGRGSEDAVGRGLVDVVDPVDWLVGGGVCFGGSEKGNRDLSEQ